MEYYVVHHATTTPCILGKRIEKERKGKKSFLGMMGSKENELGRRIPIKISRIGRKDAGPLNGPNQALD